MSTSPAPPALECPACGAADLVFDGEADFECQYCGTVLATQPMVCPSCGTKNHEGADLCSKCHEPLSIVASVLTRQGGSGPPLWLRRLQGQVGALGVAEAEASALRLHALREVDRGRIRGELEERRRSRTRNTQVLFYGTVGILGLVLLMLVIAAIAKGG